MIFCYIK